jgi:HTH-like domain
MATPPSARTSNVGSSANTEGPLARPLRAAGTRKVPRSSRRPCHSRSIAPGSLGRRVGRGEDPCPGGDQPKPAGVVWRLPGPAQVVGGHHPIVRLVCRVLGVPRSTIYARRSGGQPGRPGPVPLIDDQELVRLIRQVLKDSPFAGEGYPKVRARLRREHGVQVSGKRVLRLLRREGLLARSESVAAPAATCMTARSSLTGPTCAGYRCDHGLDSGRRVGVGVRLHGPLQRRGVGPCRQDR